jgi:hypothetical protein
MCDLENELFTHIYISAADFYALPFYFWDVH